MKPESSDIAALLIHFELLRVLCPFSLSTHFPEVLQQSWLYSAIL